jgi:hypothetical protein
MLDAGYQTIRIQNPVSSIQYLDPPEAENLKPTVKRYPHNITPGWLKAGAMNPEPYFLNTTCNEFENDS